MKMNREPIRTHAGRAGLAACAIVFVAASAVAPAGDETPWAKRVETAKIAVTGERTFGIHLLRDMADSSPRDNVFISPLSIFLALQMAGNGASGATRIAMWKTLALPDRDPAVLNSSSREMKSLLESEDRVTLKIANALWTDRRFTLAPDFARTCESAFGAHAASLNFSDSAAAGQINQWVNANTNGKIPTLVTPEMVARSAMLLTNAVYFAGEWQNKFSPRLTERENFHKANGDLKPVSMMYESRISGAYRSGATFEGAMLSYAGSDIFFYALLPRKGKTPKDILASLDPAHLRTAEQGIDLELKLPRFTIDYSSSLSKYLETMGMGIAFRFPGADFSAIGSKKFYLSEVIHKTRLEVDETGTVAAAATAVGARAGSAPGRHEAPPIREVVFNRPFVVLIGDSSTNALLFAGVIQNP
jgi:serine protease inhibitor